MYLVAQAQSGTNPPQALTPEMVPPTLRPKPGKAAAGGLQVSPVTMVLNSTFFIHETISVLAAPCRTRTAAP